MQYAWEYEDLDGGEDAGAHRWNLRPGWRVFGQTMTEAILRTQADDEGRIPVQTAVVYRIFIVERHRRTIGGGARF